MPKLHAAVIADEVFTSIGYVKKAQIFNFQ